MVSGVSIENQTWTGDKLRTQVNPIVPVTALSAELLIQRASATKLILGTTMHIACSKMVCTWLSISTSSLKTMSSDV